MIGEAQAQELAARFPDRAEPEWAAEDPKLWAVALDRLVHTRRLEVAAWAAAALRRKLPSVGVFASLDLLLREAPIETGDAGYDAFLDDVEADVQIVRRCGATSVLFVFTGVSGQAGMPLPLAHRWFGLTGAHVVYLRDRSHQAYNQGVRSLGDDYPSTLEGCWRIADDLGARTVVTCGNSIGGYGALRYGLDLRARDVLVFSGMSSMAPPLLEPDEARRMRLAAALDLRPFLQAARPPPRVLMVYGEQCAFDVRHARHLQGSPRVEQEALPGCERHESVLRAVELGRYTGFLERLAGG